VRQVVRGDISIADKELIKNGTKKLDSWAQQASLLPNHLLITMFHGFRTFVRCFRYFVHGFRYFVHGLFHCWWYKRYLFTTMLF
jgi:hypothetical protein